LDAAAKTDAVKEKKPEKKRNDSNSGKRDAEQSENEGKGRRQQKRRRKQEQEEAFEGLVSRYKSQLFSGDTTSQAKRWFEAD